MDKPALILLHGALGSAEQFKPWLPLLAGQFDTHTLDLEGHGSRAFGARPFAIGHFVENLQEFIAEKGLRQPHVFGYSMGGYVAMALAAADPQALGRIFTFATKLDWNAESSAAEARKLDPEVIQAKVPHFAQMLASRHHGNEWKEHLARTAAMMQDLGRSPVLGPEQFAAIQNVVRMGVGDRDQMVSIEETVAAYRQLAQGQLFVMPGTPHPIEKMDAVRICREIGEFLG